MKQFKQLIFTVAKIFVTLNVFGQANPFINVLPSNSGVVTQGGIIDIIVTIGNTGPISSVPQAKLRPVIQVPSSVTFLPSAQQTGLPAGWTVLSNNGSQIRVCNSSDEIPVNTSRIILLKVQGVTVTPPQTFSGNINFGNGTTCGAGTQVSGDQITDNSATSTVEVVPGAPLPLILNDFSVKSNKCITHLRWNTASEKNIDNFQIEKSDIKNVSWKAIGTIKPHGNSDINSTYYFTDDQSPMTSNEVMYRLKINDQDGSFAYSSVIVALLSCDDQKLTVFPNPVTSGTINVNLSNSDYNMASISSLTGQLIKKINLKQGVNSIDVSELSNGIYILRTSNLNGKNHNIKITINK